MSATEIASEQAIQCLRLHLVQGVGPQRFRELIEYFGSVAAVMQATPSELQQVSGVGRAISQAIKKQHDDRLLQEELERAQGLGVRIICQQDPEYPKLLREIPDAPVCLYIMGALRAEDHTALAIVGSRRCSHYGRAQAYHFAMQMARVGITVVSGLARGVDVQAHLGALEYQGRTIAVLGCGLGHLTDHEHAEVAQRIAAQGAVLSELPLQRPPDAANFPPRNRIIAGSTLGTLVVEAARRSGARITARLAGEYNREVYAIPGRIDDDYAAGTNWLIQQQHAKMVLTLQDILEELQHAAADIHRNYEDRSVKQRERIAPQLNHTEQIILEALDAQGVDLEFICGATQLPPERISNGLVMLQLKGAVEQLPGNRFARMI